MKYNVEDFDYSWLRLKKSDLKGMENPLLTNDEWSQNNFHLHVLKKIYQNHD